METAPETTVPDKATVERFLETFQDTPGSLYNAAAFLRELAGIFLPAASGRILSLLEGFIFPRRFSRIFYGTRNPCVLQGMRQDRGGSPFERKKSGSPGNLPAHLLLWAPLQRSTYACQGKCTSGRRLS